MTDSFLQHFEAIEDPRIDRCKRLELLDIILLAISAVLSGAEGWEQIEDFGIHRLDWLRRYRPFKSGIPRHDTIARVICRLKPEEIEHAFQNWMQSLIQSTGSDVIAIDGKTARRSFDTRERRTPLHAISAWSSQHQLVLGQVAVDEKSNEISAIPRLLTLLDIENCIITLDAMGCQKDIAKQIVKGKADYVFALKGNHSGMKAELEAWWHKAIREGTTPDTYNTFSTVSAGHGRIETRHCEQLLIDENWLDKDYRWAGLQSVIKVTAQVEEKLSGKKTEETRWYISSLALNAEQALDAVRSHWQVESMHWMLDVTFREDESRIRRGNGALAFKQDTSKNISMVRNKKIAAIDDEYRSVLLETGVKML